MRVTHTDMTLAIPDRCRLTSYKIYSGVYPPIRNCSPNEEDESKRNQILNSMPPKKTWNSALAKSAVVVRNAVLKYKTGQPIFSGLNMTVKSGTIYTLLGSSGCGKTSLLHCLLGIQKLDEGNVWVSMENPYTYDNRRTIIARQTGFMPQDLSLYGEFTIQETLQYFGTLYGMTDGQIKGKIEFLKELLILPCIKRRVISLSGGQQRRVSLSVALLHDPRLLILDEPVNAIKKLHGYYAGGPKRTVGLDPILRESIWKHLRILANVNQTTIIITTHYIEEARKANMIGIIRDKRIICEMPPEQFIEKFSDQAGTLESAVLNVSKRNNNINILNTNTCQLADVNMPLFKQHEHKPSWIQSFKKISALTRKNLLVILRNLPFLGFIILFPAIQMFILAVTYGYDPTNLKVGVINHELNNTSCSYITQPSKECEMNNLGCSFLEHISTDKIEIAHFGTELEAIQAVNLGSIWGYIKIPSHFSTSIVERFASGVEVDDGVLNSSQIKIRMDETNKQVSIAIKSVLYEAFESMITDLLSSCGLNPRIGASPIQYKKPALGEKETDLREYANPGVAISSLFFFPILTIGIRLVNETRSGTFSRSLIAGVRIWEIIVAYLFSHFFLLVVQAVLVFGVVRFMSDIEIVGSIYLCFLLLLIGYCGISLGFLLGSCCNNEFEVAILTLTSFLPNFVMAGILWPIEGLPYWLQYVAYILPCTLASESIRSIIFRGWGFTHGNVWPGFAMVIGHTLLYSIVAILIQKFYRSK